MNYRTQPFSERHGFVAPAAPIKVREDAPQFVREALLQIASKVGLGPSDLRGIACEELLCLPDSNNWSEYPNIWSEVQNLVLNCPWYKVYDIAEAIYVELRHRQDVGALKQFVDRLNKFFAETGVGWQLLNGHIQTRGDEAFETITHDAASMLASAGLSTAGSEIQQAILDLSRRPDPDLTGAVQHAMAALECVARTVTGDSKSTLGEILKRHPNVLPKPLDSAVDKAWGYASEQGRHLREGQPPTRAETELIVKMSATIATYLVQKLELPAS